MKTYRDYDPNAWGTQVHHKNFRETTKYRVLKALADAEAEGRKFTRKDAMHIIWENQGYDPAKFVYRPGNSSTGFTTWVHQGLMEMSGGRWYATPGTMDYVRCETRAQASRCLYLLKCERKALNIQNTIDWNLRLNREVRSLRFAVSMIKKDAENALAKYED